MHVHICICMFICISLENSTKKTLRIMVVSEEQNWGRERDFTIYFFILFEF